MKNMIRTRFAPSPTGYMHIGNLRTALYAYFYARSVGGQFILRIEDTDLERYVEGAKEVIYDTLKEVGIDYDEGPDVGGAYGPYIQSERKAEYMTFARELVDRGGAYYCFCSKDRLETLPSDGEAKRYDKRCLHLSKEEVQRRLNDGEPFVIRQNMPTEGISKYTDMVFGEISIENKELEDNILIKSDGMPTYNFANVVDDHQMAINCVIRGAEYLTSTPKYNLLYDSFGWERPMYVHLPSIMRDAQHKLSKRNGAAGYSDFIAQGFLKEAIINYIVLLGWSPKNDVEKMSFDEMKRMFNLEGISKSNAIFDEVKMKWLNSLYIKELPFDKFFELSKPWLINSPAKNYDLTIAAKLAHSRIDTLADIPLLMQFLNPLTEFDTELYVNAKLKSTVENAKNVLPMVYDCLSGLEMWDNSSIYTALINLAAEKGLKNGQVLWPSRVAVSGMLSTPGGASELAEIFGKTETLERIKQSINSLQKN